MLNYDYGLFNEFSKELAIRKVLSSNEELSREHAETIVEAARKLSILSFNYKHTSAGGGEPSEEGAE
jgi:hypothetical protein